MSVPSSTLDNSVIILHRSESSRLFYNFKSAIEIPKYCLQLAVLLAEQPLFDGSGSLVKKCKVLMLEHSADVSICSIFSRNVAEFLGYRHAWPIHGEHTLYNSNNDPIPNGMTLWLFDDVEMCSLDTLQDEYNRVLASMTVGWVSAKLEDNSDIMFQEDKDEFALFIKNNPLFEERDLIHLIAKRLSVSNDVKCGEYWLDDSKSFKIIYLWIRKSAFFDIVDKFGFKF